MISFKKGLYLSSHEVIILLTQLVSPQKTTFFLSDHEDNIIRISSVNGWSLARRYTNAPSCQIHRPK